jgi:hypothetical protein
MKVLLRYVGQAVWYGLVAAVLGWLGTGPAYSPFPDDRAQIKLSFAHGARREAADCRRRTAEELAKLPHRERSLYACDRRRLPIRMELALDGKPIFARTVEPGGLGGDSPARVYERFVVAPGRHTLAARLRDSARSEGFDYEKTVEVTLRPRQNLVIDFRAAEGGFIIH